MNLPVAFLAVRCLVRDTLRQAVALRLVAVMVLLTAIAVVFCLSVSTARLPRRPHDGVAERLPPDQAGKVAPFELERSGVDVIDGEVRFLFGAVRVPWRQYRDDAVRWLHLLLAGAVADTIGLLFALIGTAAFLPTFVDPGAVTVLLAKPVPRWSLLAGKYLGILVLVAVQATLFVGATWLALALRTGVWSPSYLWSAPLLVLHFAVFFAFSAFLAVWTRSTVVCVFGALLFWLLCWGMNYGRHAALMAAAQAGMTTHFSWALEVGYWLLPKPADLSYALSKTLEANVYFPMHRELQAVEGNGGGGLELSLVSSVLFGLVMLAIAGYEFVQAEY